MRANPKAAALAALVVLAASAVALAQDAPKADATKPPEKIDLPPFPPDAHTEQVTHVAGKALNYTATVGSLPIRDETGKKIAEVVFTAYTLDGVKDRTSRPVTFAFNGGPGAASVYLNLGAMGPKRIQFGGRDDAASDSVVLNDNPGSWLDFTDLVFIDPVGTGFSRSLVPREETEKKFWAADPDIKYLSRIVYDWLLKNERMASPKYVVGESYGGYRGPRITYTLQTEMGVGVNGLVLVSPFLDKEAYSTRSSPMGYVDTLPSMAASNYERQGKALSPQTLADVESYARGEFVRDLLLGARDKAAVDRIVQHVTQYTGLDPTFVRQSGGRIDIAAFLRALYRDEGKLGSIYDPNVVGYDPFPWSAQGNAGDPILNSVVASTSSAMVDFDTRVVGWKVDGHFEALSWTVASNWDSGKGELSAVEDLRKAIAQDPHLKVLIAHGYDDLACPYFASKLIVDAMPLMGDPNRVAVREYPGGHMFYSRPGSEAEFRSDVMKLFGVRN
jgi:carboxypeptidase C (cathepsin A)